MVVVFSQICLVGTLKKDGLVMKDGENTAESRELSNYKLKKFDTKKLILPFVIIVALACVIYFKPYFHNREMLGPIPFVKKELQDYKLIGTDLRLNKDENGLPIRDEFGNALTRSCSFQMKCRDGSYYFIYYIADPVFVREGQNGYYFRRSDDYSWYDNIFMFSDPIMHKRYYRFHSLQWFWAYPAPEDMLPEYYKLLRQYPKTNATQ